jgi:hypothetical protein
VESRAQLGETELEAFKAASRRMHNLVQPGLGGDEMVYICRTPELHLGCLPVVVA